MDSEYKKVAIYHPDDPSPPPIVKLFGMDVIADPCCPRGMWYIINLEAVQEWLDGL